MINLTKAPFFLVKEDIEWVENTKKAMTLEEKIGQLEKSNSELSDQLTEAQLALTEQYEANLALEDEVTNTQLALTELYEATQTTTTTKEA